MIKEDSLLVWLKAVLSNSPADFRWLNLWN